MNNIALTLLFCVSLALSAAAQDYDLVILNGRVIDPETELDAVRNIGINHGIITAITTEALTGKETIDAKGLVVAPGFIDTHWHGMDPYGFKLGLRDGLTTALELEVGVYPVDDFYDQFDGQAQVNYGASVSHAWARMALLDNIDPKGLGLYGTALKDSMRAVRRLSLH